MSITLVISLGKFSWTIAFGTEVDVGAEQRTVLASEGEVSEVESETRIVGFVPND